VREAVYTPWALGFGLRSGLIFVGDPYMTTNLHISLLLIALAMIPATPVLGDEIGELPQVQMHGDITYVTGGIGQDESCAMKAAAGNYDLMLTFAERDGSYVADVDVQIIDSSGNAVLQTVSGPLLLANLPAGKYRVQADYNGATRWRTANVGGSHPDRLTFTWPSEYGNERATSGGAEFSAFEIREPRRVQACP
jgi:hypothetical protein